MAVIITPNGHRFDRIQPPPMAPHRMLTMVSPDLPDVVDLRVHCGPLKNQGNEGSCTGHADTENGEWIFRAYHGKQPIFSPQYTYEKELLYDGNFPNDSGSDGETACIVAIASGFCELSLDPYVAGQIEQPTADQDTNAAQWKLGAYHGLTGSAVAKSVLGDPVPWPVLMGFTVYSSFESDATAQTGIYNPDPSTESVLGGHEVLVVGYDFGATPTLRPAACPPAFLVMNSWGPWGWNNSGFFWATEAVLNDPQTDLKICHSGGPWK
jgi:C1A family cysteine protease